ncbi:MAG: restriction endonuclease subunit S, partial [Nanoarchaeota archaeon]|nr:restriction endonuclease subunit S [Nanoarchaeota archaeon]
MENEGNKVKVGEIFYIEKGSLQSLKNISGEYPFLTGSEKWISHKDYSHDCEALAFVMGAAGSLGRVHYIKGKFIASDLCFILTPKEKYKSKIDLEFYKIYFNMMRKSIVKELSTGTSKIAINLNNFSNYEIPFPSLNIQLKTKNKFNFMNERVLEFNIVHNSNESYISKLRQAIFQEAVQGKLVPQDPNDEPASELLKKIQKEKDKLIKEGKVKKGKDLAKTSDDEIPYELPGGWEWTRLGDVCEIIMGQSPPSSSYNQNKIGIPFYQGKFDFGKISPT